MEERIEVANFTLIKSCDNSFYGELDLKNTFLFVYKENNINVSVFGKVYDFDNNQKSYIKLKFIDYDHYLYRYGFYTDESGYLYHDDGGYGDREAEDSDVPEIGFDDENDNPGEIGEGIIYLESSKISPNSPDFHGNCKINDYRQLDSRNFTAEIDYNFEVVGWYSRKILNDDIKINLKMNYDKQENCEIWLAQHKEMSTDTFIGLLAFNIDIGVKVNDYFINYMFHEMKLYDKILNQNLINQGYEIAEQFINQKSEEENKLGELIKWEKEKSDEHKYKTAEEWSDEDNDDLPF